LFGQAYDHGIKIGIKDKVGSILRANMALMDTDSDNYVSCAELRTYAAKVLILRDPVQVAHSSHFISEGNRMPFKLMLVFFQSHVLVSVSQF
jgi:hypothetical protein